MGEADPKVMTLEAATSDKPDLVAEAATGNGEDLLAEPNPPSDWTTPYHTLTT